MKNNYKKTLDEILNKKFSKNYSIGYDPLEVDMFFDKIRTFISKQYQKELEYQKIIQEKDKKIENLESKIDKSKQSIAVLNSEIKKYVDDGYQSQRMINQISDLRREIADLKNDKKE
ncbi:DivIVA domain-containing protein [Malacoplasma muris]|uniref:DivIVA domain-containing protein n=1 Tax=Malacoplasma muris TaxID=2119 RepID=UPI00398F2242